MIKINLKTKLGYRKQNINESNLIYYRKTKKGYSRKKEEIVKKIHEKIIEKRQVVRYKIKLVEIKKYQEQKRQLKRKQLEKRRLKEPEIKEKEKPKTYYNWLCTCKVSDRKFNHIFGVSSLIGSDEDYVITQHEKYYPDHELINIELNNNDEDIKKLDRQLKRRKNYITKTKGVHFYD